MATAALLLGLAAAPACSLITGPDLQVTIEELSVTIVERSQFAEISAEGSGIVVDGVMAKATPCQRLVAEGDLQRAREGNLVRLVVGDEFSESRCGSGGLLATAYSEYQARIGGLEPGGYSVEVIHTFRTGWPDTLVAQEIIQVR